MQSSDQVISLVQQTQEYQDQTLIFQKLDIQGQKPVNRFGAQVCSLNNEIFLFGGQAHVRQNYVWKINLSVSEWYLLVEGPPMKYGSSMVIFKDKLVIYGGVSKRRKTYKEQHFYPYSCKMNLIDYQWENKPLNIEPRAFHSSCIIGNWLIVSGGRGKSGKFLNDTWAINLDTNEEVLLKLSLDQLIQHSITPVFQDSVLNNNYLDLNSIACQQDEGFYIFGGMDQSGKFLSNLQLLNPMTWKCETLSNEQIPPRSSHISFFYQKQLWIYGGQNKSGSDIQPLNDCQTWHVERKQWRQIQIPGLIPRRSPFGVLIQHELILFSQENDNEELLVVNLNS